MSSSVKYLFSNLFRKRLGSTYYGLTEIYRPSINRNKDKLKEVIKEKAEIALQSTVVKKLRVLKGYYTVEMAPPSSAAELKKLKDDIVLLKEFFRTGCYKQLTVRQAWLIFLVLTEVYLWFYLGETIGKMHIVGYKV